MWRNAYVCTYLFFSKKIIFKHGIAIATSIFGLAFNAFLEKSASYMFMYYTRLHILLTIHTNGNVIVLSDWDTRPPQPDILKSRYPNSVTELTSPCHHPIKSEHQTMVVVVSIHSVSHFLYGRLVKYTNANDVWTPHWSPHVHRMQYAINALTGSLLPCLVWNKSNHWRIRTIITEWNQRLYYACMTRRDGRMS